MKKMLKNLQSSPFSSSTSINDYMTIFEASSAIIHWNIKKQRIINNFSIPLKTFLKSKLNFDYLFIRFSFLLKYFILKNYTFFFFIKNWIKLFLIFTTYFKNINHHFSPAFFHLAFYFSYQNPRVYTHILPYVVFVSLM